MRKILKWIFIVFFSMLLLVGCVIFYFRGQISFYMNVYKEYPTIAGKIESASVFNNSNIGTMINSKKITYKESNGKDITLDIYEGRKSLKKGAPVIIYVHGGSWIYGNSDIPSFMEPILDVFRNEGYTIVSVDYRKDFKKIDFEEQVSDVKDAIRWINKNANEYRLNKDEIGLIGISAGAQLSLMAGYTDDNMFNGYEPLAKYSSKVKWIVDLFGPTDLKGLNMNIATGDLKKAINEREASLKGRNSINEYMEKYSPINYVKKGLPNTFIVHGDNDKIVPFKDSERFYNKLKENGNNAKILKLENCEHDLGNIDKKQIIDFSIRFVNFIIFNTNLR